MYSHREFYNSYLEYICPNFEEIKFYIADVFAEEKHAGNQLAVFTDADFPSANQMQRFAKERHYSETAFLVSANVRDSDCDFI